MKNAKHFTKYSFILAASVSLLTACNPTKKNGPAAEPAGFAKVSTLDEKSATCEQRLRADMKNRAIKFQQVANFSEELNQANAALPTLSKTIYSVGKKGEVPSSIELGFSQKKSVGYQAFKYALDLNDKNARSSFSFSIGFSWADGRTSSELEQSFQVSETCALMLTKTKLSKTFALEKNRFRNLLATIYANGESSETPTDFVVPEGKSLTELTEPLSSVTSFRDGNLAFMDGVGLIEAKLTPEPETRVTEFNQQLSLSNFKIEIFSNGQSILTAIGGATSDQRFSYYTIARQSGWQIPGDVWETVTLGTVRVDTTFFKKEFDDKYLLEHDTYTLSTNQPLTYDHLSAYWYVLTRVVLPSGAEDDVLQERPVPTVADTATAADLASNDTIQTLLPEIQAIANSIRATKPVDRRQKIVAILKYLKNNYVYDYEMLKNNTIRPLTTKEALTRKKGVCQHYAVLFTAIARALEVPTRIVVGFALFSGQPGGHAWVEAQVEPGLWQVIEPQSEAGLEKTYTRFYFPTDRAYFLEDKNASMGPYYAKILKTNYTARPVN